MSIRDRYERVLDDIRRREQQENARQALHHFTNRDHGTRFFMMNHCADPLPERDMWTGSSWAGSRFSGAGWGGGRER